MGGGGENKQQQNRPAAHVTIADTWAVHFLAVRISVNPYILTHCAHEKNKNEKKKKK